MERVTRVKEIIQRSSDGDKEDVESVEKVAENIAVPVNTRKNTIRLTKAISI